jgi:hypothetical protein
LATLRCAFRTNLPRCFRRGCSRPLLGCYRFVAESSYSALGDFQFVEPVTKLRTFGIEPRELLGNSPLLLSDLV